MTRAKLCGLTRMEDIEAANRLCPEYIGFVFAGKSRRYIEPEAAEALKKALDPSIQAVGVFVDEDPDVIGSIVKKGIIDVVQLHGHEDEEYIEALRRQMDVRIIQAFVIRSEEDVAKAQASTADYVLLDAGRGDGNVFDWRLVEKINRDYFLAGGLGPEIVGSAVSDLEPYAVDVSSGIETDGIKDEMKMEAFVKAVRKEDIDD